MSFYATRPLSESALLYLARTGRYPMPLRIAHALRYARCLVFGHRLRQELWTRAGTGSELVPRVGCARCPYLKNRSSSPERVALPAPKC